MASASPIDDLSKLTERQLEVLRLVCEGLGYKEVGERLFITTAAVKSHMGNIYVKLGLDQIPPTQRRLLLFQAYCPALKGETVSPTVDITEEPESVPEEVIKMVDDDEKAIVPYRPKPPQVIEIIPLPPEPRPQRRLRGLFVGIVFGAFLAALVGFVIWQILDGDGSPAPIVTPEEEAALSPPTEQSETELEIPVPTATIEEVVVIVTATPEPASPTVQIVTATSIPATPTPPPPTNTPKPTQSPNTPPGTRLQPGQTWKQDGFHLTLERVRFDTWFGEGEVWLSFSVTNRTGAPISVELYQEDITVEASNGTLFKQVHSNSPTVWRETLEHGVKADVWLSARTNYRWLGDYFSPDVSYILVTVRNWSRISEAVWQIDVQH